MNRIRQLYTDCVKGGQFVREARRRAGMTQEQLASRVGLSQPTIARIESGKISPSLERVISLVRATGFDLQIRVVPLDEENATIAEQNLRLSPDERIQKMLGTLRLEEAGRRARGEIDASVPAR